MAREFEDLPSVTADIGGGNSAIRSGEHDSGAFLIFDMNTLREVVYLTQTYNAVFLAESSYQITKTTADGFYTSNATAAPSSNFITTTTPATHAAYVTPDEGQSNHEFGPDDGPAFQAPIVAAILEKTRKKILRETILTSAIAISALLAIIFTLLALLLGRRKSTQQLATRRYAMVVSLLCSNGLIASRFFGIPVTIWVAESQSLWNNVGIVCAEKFFESAFYAGNISEMLTLCVLAVYHFCYIVPSWPQVNKIRQYISAKYSLVGVWFLSLLLGFADFYVVLVTDAPGGSNGHLVDDASCEKPPTLGPQQQDSSPRYCMVVSCRDSATQRAWWAVGLVSLVIMTASYATIFVRIFQTTPLPTHVVHHQATLSILCRKRGLITTIMIFLSFVLCSVPYSITEVFLKLTRPNPAEQSNRDLMVLLKVIGYLQLLILLNCFLDTIIYVVRMPEVKNGYGYLAGELLYVPVRLFRIIRRCCCYRDSSRTYWQRHQQRYRQGSIVKMIPMHQDQQQFQRFARAQLPHHQIIDPHQANQYRQSGQVFCTNNRREPVDILEDNNSRSREHDQSS